MFPSPHQLDDWREDIMARRGVGMGVAPSGGGSGGSGTVAHSGLRQADPGHN